MIYEMGNFLCVLASIVIMCIILLYPWVVTVLRINDFFSFSGVSMEKTAQGVWQRRYEAR